MTDKRWGCVGMPNGGATATRVYRLSPTFCNDHWSRDCGETDTIVKEGKFCVYVRLDPQGYADMLSDAELYSDHTQFDPPQGFYHLAQSAKRVAAVLKQDGPPVEDTGPDQSLIDNAEVKITRFGWCIQGDEADHDGCRARFYSDFDGKLHVCKCACHQQGGDGEQT